MARSYPDPWTSADLRRLIQDPSNRAIVGDELWEEANRLLTHEEADPDQIEGFAVGATKRVVNLIGVQSPSTYWEALERKWALVKNTPRELASFLAIAAVYFLHREIIDVISASSASLGRWEMQPSDFITPQGFVWLERPLGDMLGMQGFIWLTHEDKVMLVSHDVLGPRATLGGHFGNDALDPKFLEAERNVFNVGGFDESSIADLRFIAATVLFVSQEILVRSEEHPPRHVARRLSREQRSTAGTESVSVLVLRRQHTRSDVGGVEPDRPVDWAWRWAVRGHWRQQPIGPARSQRRPVWIHPYVKGPDDRPFKPPDGQIFDVRR